jgi:hypothetical protein
MTMATQTVVELIGLNGSNPLAFFAALGAQRVIERMDCASVRISWAPLLHPVLAVSQTHTAHSISDLLSQGVKQIEADGVAAFGNIIGVAAGDFRHFLKSAVSLRDVNVARICSSFAAAYGSDAAIDEKKQTAIPTALSFSNGQGGKLLLKDFRTLAGRVSPQKVHEALFQSWTYSDADQPTFRWDPSDMRTGAHMATDPGTTETRSVLAANALAFVGLSFLPTVPVSGGLRTSCVGFLEGEFHLRWPLWDAPLSVDAVSALLQQADWPDSIGIIARFASRRLMYKKNLYLGPSFAI